MIICEDKGYLACETDDDEMQYYFDHAVMTIKKEVNAVGGLKNTRFNRILLEELLLSAYGVAAVYEGRE